MLLLLFVTFSKLAALRIALDGITSKRRNAYRSHHASSEPTDLATLKSIYVELAALRSYCDLNQTGFYKIIKKYDKIMEVKKDLIDDVINHIQDFCTCIFAHMP